MLSLLRWRSGARAWPRLIQLGVCSAAFLSALCLLGACRTDTPGRLDPALAGRTLATYAELASANYRDVVSSTRALQRALDTLIVDPSEQTLALARVAWQRARVPYAQSEVFRFYGGPIDRVELLVNTWPIDENYVEGASDSTDKGVIDDPQRYPDLTPELLVSLNGRGETSISTGYHVIEFLLWGADLSETGPGTRPASDFVARADDPRPARRCRYLQLVGALLVQHLEQVEAAWRADGPSNYRSEFLQRPAHQALGLALRGMGALSGPELSGERLTVPYETRDQENEHSCFSDTTRDDLVNDALGLQNVCMGRYAGLGRSLRGPGLCALLERVDGELGRTLTRQIDESVAAARAIPSPFDSALLGPDEGAGRRAIKQTILSLESVTATLARAASLLGVAAQLARSKP